MNDIQFRNDIAKFFTPSNEEKKTNAEIPTPVKLVNEMLDKIPEDFWTTPKKVFEPCCGKGNFVLGIIDKFYTGLEEMFPNKKRRCNVILNQCLFYADISNNNVLITTQLVKYYLQFKLQSKIKYKLKYNSYTGNTLELDIQNEFGIHGFDAVIGNPPYNSSAGVGTGNTIWQHFTKVSLNKFIKNNGYLLYIHPPGWRKPNTKKGKYYGLYNLMIQENQMIYLSIHGIKDGKKTFNCGTRYDWYLIQKTYSDKRTTVKDQLGIEHIIQLKNWVFLPNHSYNIIKPLLGVSENVIYSRNQYGSDKKWVKDTNTGISENVIYSSNQYRYDKKWVNDDKTDKFKYPLIHSTTKKGVIYKWTNTIDPPVKKKVEMFGVSKVIFGESGINNVIIDMDGEYGLSNGSIGIKIDSIEEGFKLKKILESDMFKKVLNGCSWSNYRIEYILFTYFKKDFWKEFIKDEQSENVIFSNNQYETRKKWVQHDKTDEFKYPLIHSTNKKGIRYRWSNTTDPPVKKKIDMFGVSKVIFGVSGINDVIIDMDGTYGLTNHAIGIKIDSIEEGFKLKKTLESEMFKKVLNSCSWSNYTIEWRLFNYLKKDFWKEFK